MWGENMIDRQKDILRSWVEEVASRQRQSVESDQERVRTRKKEIRQKIKEGLTYLKTTGAVAVLKDTAKQLKIHWGDVRLRVEKDENYEYPDVGIKLTWNYTPYYHEGHLKWNHDMVLCDVVRSGRNGPVIGLRIKGGILEDVDRGKISEQVVEAVKNPTRMYDAGYPSIKDHVVAAFSPKTETRHGSFATFD